MAGTFNLPTANRPIVKATVEGSELLASGTAVIRADQALDLQIANLSFKVRFATSDGSHAVRFENAAGTHADIVLLNFTNALGTVLKPLKIAKVNEKSIWLSAFVETVNEVQVVSYSIYWGDLP